MPFKTLFLAAAVPLLLSATAIPAASPKPALNLQHYLSYQFDDEIDLRCKETKTHFVCESHDQKIVEHDENNASTVTAFKKAQISFNAAASLQLEEKIFSKTMEELRQSEKERQKRLASQQPYFNPPSTPLQDQLDRALVGNLEQIRIDHLAIHSDDPQTDITIEKIAYDNTMKKTAKGIAFSERILGEIRLDYTHAVVDTNDTASFYRSLPLMIEAWLDTNDTKRADYVGEKLAELYNKELRSPVSGSFLLKTAYLGNDAIAVDIKAHNGNTKGSKNDFAFSGELRNASTLFKPARKPIAPGTPDFLFHSIHTDSATNGTAYRQLLKKDKTLAGYIGQYDLLLRTYFDKKLEKYRANPILSSWFEQAKSAFSKIVTGTADHLAIDIKNKNGVTAMQVFGMLMGQLMVMPQQGTAQQPDEEKIIADTAAQNLDVKIKAY